MVNIQEEYISLTGNSWKEVCHSKEAECNIVILTRLLSFLF